MYKMICLEYYLTYLYPGLGLIGQPNPVLAGLGWVLVFWFGRIGQPTFINLHCTLQL
jgi:hypothetical protein